MRPLSPIDSMFLLLENRHQPMHVGGLQLFSLPENAEPHFVANFVEAARAHAPQPPFSQHIERRRGRRVWVEDKHFDIEHHVRHASLPYPGRVRELLALVSRLHGTQMDRSRPLWEATIIEGLEDGRMAVYYKIHHAMFDGVAAMRAMQTNMTNDPNELHGPPLWARKPKRRPRAPEQTLEDQNPFTHIFESLRSNYRVIPGFLHGLQDVVRKRAADPGDVSPFQAPPTILNQRITGARRFAAQSYSLERIKRIGHKHDATVNDITLTLCGGALRSYLDSLGELPNSPLVAMVPVSVRSADSAEGGNQITMLLTTLATDIADPLERLQAIKHSVEVAKERLRSMTRIEQIAYAGAISAPLPLSSLVGFDRYHPLFNVVISNVPGPRETLYWNGAKLDELYPLSIPIDGQALNITLTSYGDQLGFGFIACRKALPSMQRLLDNTAQALDELEAAGDQ